MQEGQICTPHLVCILKWKASGIRTVAARTPQRHKHGGMTIRSSIIGSLINPPPSCCIRLISSHHPRPNQHLPTSRPLQPINTQMLPPVSSNVDSKRIPGRAIPPCLLTSSRHNQSTHQICLCLQLPERWIRQERALVHEAEQIGQGMDLVREIALPLRPDEEERRRVDGHEDNKGVV